MSLVLILGATARTLVLPFDVRSDDPDQGWKGVAFEETISSHFESAGVDVVDVLERNRLLDEIGVVPGEPLAEATAKLAARELRVERLIVGTLTPSPEGVTHVEARLIDLDKDTTIGLLEDYGPSEELFSLASLVAKNLFRLERDAVPSGFDTCASRRGRIAPEALEAGARARVALDAVAQRGHLERAIELSDDYLEAHLLLGRLLLREGLARDAIDVLVRARGEDALYRKAYFELGVAYLMAEQSRAALSVFQSLAETGAPGSGASFNNLGVALMRLARFDEATAAFRESCDRGEQATCLFNLGWAYWRSGKGAKALEQFEKVSALRPLDAEARLLHGAAALSQALPDESERSRATAILLSPRLADVDPSTMTGWERVLDRHQSQDSYRHWEPSVAGSPSWTGPDLETIADLLDARVLHERGRRDEAIQLLQRSLYRDPSASGIRRELVGLHYEAGALGSAASELSILVWTDPSAEAHVELARLYLQMEEPARAREEVERALELDPDHADALRLKQAIGPPAAPN